jgi:hypothetical protein
MTASQFLLDAALARKQPVQGRLHLVKRRILNAKFLSQSRRPPDAYRSQFRARADQAAGDRGNDQVSFPARSRGQHGIEPEPADSAKDRLDMAVWERAGGGEHLARHKKFFARQASTHELDQAGRQVGDIAERLVTNRGAVAIPAARRIGDVLAPIPASNDLGNVNGASSARHVQQVARLTGNVKTPLKKALATFCKMKPT